MKLTNEITVPAPIDEAWALILDVERVAPCLPGASVEQAEDDQYKGSMKVKIGPIVSTFEGTLKIDETDEEAHRAVLNAKARDSRGKGSANATITSTLVPADEGTQVTVETDLRVTGPAASFGRGVMQDVSAMLMTQFADCLATKLGREAPAEAAAAAKAPAAEEPAAAEEEGEPVARAQALPDDVPTPPGADTEAPPAPEPAQEDVLDLGAAGREVLGRRAAGPAVAAFLLFVLLVLLLRRRSR